MPGIDALAPDLTETKNGSDKRKRLKEILIEYLK